MNDRLRTKLTALLRLAKEGSPAEANMALQAARRLMAEHGINEEDLNRRSLYTTGAIECQHEWVQFCIHAACILYGVVPVFQNRHHTEVVICGNENMVSAAVMTIEFLVGQVETEYKRALPHRMTRPDRAKYRKDFKRTCAIALLTRSREIADAMPRESGKALVLYSRLNAERDRIIEELKNAPGGITSSSVPLKVRTSMGSIDGILASERIDLNQKVE